MRFISLIGSFSTGVLLKSLEAWLGIFAVTAIIVIVVYILNKIFAGKQ